MGDVGNAYNRVRDIGSSSIQCPMLTSTNYTVWSMRVKVIKLGSSKEKYEAYEEKTSYTSSTTPQSLYLQMISYGHIAKYYAQSVINLTKQKEENLRKGVLCKNVVKKTIMEDEREMVRFMSENPRFGNPQAEENEYFNRSIVETASHERDATELALKRSNLFNEERPTIFDMGKKKKRRKMVYIGSPSEDNFEIRPRIVKSLTKILQVMEKKNKKEEKECLKLWRKDSDSDMNYDVCCACHYGGELLLCDGYPSTFHSSCLSLLNLPEEDIWFCPCCCCNICGTMESQRKSWFCNRQCNRVFTTLKSLLGYEITVGDDGDLVWTLIRAAKAKVEAGNLATKNKELNQTLKAAGEIESNQMKIEEEGGVEALLVLVQSSQNSEIFRVAFSAIANLAINEKSQDLIMNKGGAQLLAKMVTKTDDPQTLRMVVGALANLCGNEKFRETAELETYPVNQLEASSNLTIVLATEKKEKKRKKSSKDHINHYAVANTTLSRDIVNVDPIPRKDFIRNLLVEATHKENKICDNKSFEEVGRDETETNNMASHLDKKKRKRLGCATEKLKVLKGETSELSIPEMKLKELVEQRGQRFELLAEANRLKVEKTKFETEWKHIDMKREEIRKEAEYISRQRDALRKKLKEEKDDVESLNGEREEFMNKEKEELEILSREREKVVKQEKKLKEERIQSFKETTEKELEHVQVKVRNLGGKNFKLMGENVEISLKIA